MYLGSLNEACMDSRAFELKATLLRANAARHLVKAPVRALQGLRFESQQRREPT